MALKIHVVFWVVTLCNDVVGYQHFGGPAASVFRVKFEGGGTKVL